MLKKFIYKWFYLRNTYLKTQIPSFSHVFIKGNLNRSNVSKCQKLWGNKNIWQITLKILTEKFFTCEKESITFSKSKSIKNLKLVFFDFFDTKLFTQRTVRSVRFSCTAVAEVGRDIREAAEDDKIEFLFTYFVRVN